MFFFKNRINKNNKNLINTTSIPECAINGCFHLEMNGNREIIIDGCKGILEYDENVIKINTSDIILSFIGRNLSIKCMTSESLIIKGYIVSIEFIK